MFYAVSAGLVPDLAQEFHTAPHRWRHRLAAKGLRVPLPPCMTSRRLMTIPGVDQLTALAFVAAIDDPETRRLSGSGPSAVSVG
jgi:transposase